MKTIKCITKTRAFVLATSTLLLVQVFSCKKDSTPPPVPPVVTDQSFSTSFENKDSLVNQGWVFTNLSDFPGQGWDFESETSWGAAPYDGSKLLDNNPFLATEDPYDTLTGAAVISDWLISPKLFLQNGDKISFYTLSHGSIGYGAGGSYGDRLQLRLNVFNTSDSIGTASSDVGHFTTPLLDINPLYKTTPSGDYPSTWTKYEATITGLNQPDSGRFALRYFLELSGGAHGDEIAVDKLEFTSAGH
ncbi:hypothetical protein FC093_04650 [Ilyomonas limi]|uniref:Uncharacterized protein n=1 Tax=Ilyomonas limi TaxID=2575867 RepID=A0A4U3LAC3_9BACT|nr:choice-of-anchor J domain-containing protein [Ilyomonas limi]TKK70976.1 hypothetical protein FC093_04650 [Ilyomonas limi]